MFCLFQVADLSVSQTQFTPSSWHVADSVLALHITPSARALLRARDSLKDDRHTTDSLVIAFDIMGKARIDVGGGWAG